jgi:hypothetical protein
MACFTNKNSNTFDFFKCAYLPQLGLALNTPIKTVDILDFSVEHLSWLDRRLGLRDMKGDMKKVCISVYVFVQLFLLTCSFDFSHMNHHFYMVYVKIYGTSYFNQSCWNTCA